MSLIPWPMVAKLAFSTLIAALNKVPPEKWASIGTMLINFLNTLANNLPAGHPVFSILNSYRAPVSKLAPPKPAEPWGN